MSRLTYEAWWKTAFETLLWLLDPERDKAEKNYLDLFNQLAAFFGRRGRTNAEDLAEETLTRVARLAYRRLSGQEHHTGTEDIPVARHAISPETYALQHRRIGFTAFAVAKNLLAEKYREPASGETDDPESLEAADTDEANEIAEERHQRLDRVLAELSSEDRQFILEYYTSGDDGKQRTRQALARELDIPVSAVINKAKRIRRRIVARMTEDEVPVEAQFTAFYPQSLDSRAWSTILAYMHLADVLPLVQSDSRRRLEGGAGVGRRTTVKKVAVARGAQILVVPQSEELEFNPPQVGFAWLEDFHCAEFRCRVRSSANSRGTLQYAAVKVGFYVTPILMAEISFTINLSRESKQSRQTASLTAHPYQRVFVSYSRMDSGIANQLEKAYKALGIEYLRDVHVLRSGEKWAPALLERIDESEIFQLLWSKAAKRSTYVRHEWQHALKLRRSFFIRPVYWKKPMPRPPRKLANLQFAYLELRGKHL